MARLRSLKPEFWTSEQIMNLAPAARLTFIGLWTHCDDGGNHPASARTLKAEVFPSDDISTADVQGMVDALIGEGLVREYTADWKRYWHVTGWAKHQRIDKPTFKHPKPEKLDEPSATVPRAFDEDLPSARGVLARGEERSGEEGHRRGAEKVPTPDHPADEPATMAVATAPDSAPVTDAEYWQSGVDLIAKSGVSDRQARAFLGKLCKDGQKPAVINAIGQAILEQPADPRAYIRKACEVRKRPAGRHNLADQNYREAL